MCLNDAHESLGYKIKMVSIYRMNRKQLEDELRSYQMEIIGNVKDLRDSVRLGREICKMFPNKTVTIIKTRPLDRSDNLYNHLCIALNRDILDIQEIINPVLEARFEAQRAKIKASNGSVSVARVFHGTKDRNIQPIINDGFDVTKNVTSAYGKGTYFAKDPNMSCAYNGGSDKLLCCDVLVGKIAQGHQFKESTTPLERNIDNVCDDINNPNIITTTHSDGAIPRFIITYRMLR